jgi:hypothetical protein
MKLLIALLPLLLSCCSGQISNTSLGTWGIMYPITADEADRVMAQAMVGEFPGSPISGVTLPNRGYVVTISWGLDSHRISVVAIPATGIDANGNRLQGFSFEVSHQGTMLLSAPPRATSLFSGVNQLATAIRPPIHVANVGG